MSPRRKGGEESEEDATVELEPGEVVEPDAAPEPDVEPEPAEELEPTPEVEPGEEPDRKRPTIVPEGVAPTNPAAFQQAVDVDSGRPEGDVWVEGGTLTYSDPAAVPDDREPVEEQADVEPRTFTSRDPNPEE